MTLAVEHEVKTTNKSNPQFFLSVLILLVFPFLRCQIWNCRGHSDAVGTHLPPTSEVCGSTPDPLWET